MANPVSELKQQFDQPSVKQKQMLQEMQSAGQKPAAAPSVQAAPAQPVAAVAVSPERQKVTAIKSQLARAADSTAELAKLEQLIS